MLADAPKFYSTTKNKNFQVVCLTATPDDGFAEGAEKKLIDVMGYRRIKTQKEELIEAPIIEKRAKMNSASNVFEQI